MTVGESEELWYYRRMRRFTPVVLIAILLTGCISSEMEITLEQDGSGEVRLTYEFSEELYGLGVFDESDVARPIPVTREEFEEAALVSGARLRSYSLSSNDGDITVQARLSFDTLETLGLLLGREALTVALDDDGGSLTYRLSDGSADASPDLAASLDDYTITLRLNAPADISTAQPGELLDESTAELSLSLGDVARDTELIEWRVDW